MLRSLRNGYSTNSADWNYMSLSQFELLRSLCRLVKRTVDNAIEIFNRAKIIVSQLSQQDDFLVQCRTIVDSFSDNTQNNFDRAIDLNDVLRQGDLLVSGLETNYRFYGVNNNETGMVDISASAVTIIKTSGVLCNCFMSSACVTEVSVPNFHGNGRIIIPGWLSGCYVQDALFLSTLECYFYASCMMILRQTYNVALNVQPIQMRNNSKFTAKTTVGTIVQQIFVDQWLTTYNFTAYFEACAPKTCLYKVDEKRSLVVIIGTLVGIWGGLTKALDLTIPRAVKFLRTRGRRRFQNSMVHVRNRQIEPAPS